ncbi:hypothetical protein [Streptomyces sp. NEAU-W12]|uniref:hypothetical protein n=1 Tax=Streptomyces sp. NEAU-W12 TaxID=2994668 RepID=UPI00224B2BDE|nr:hypothetical protein [Streptomyces sp. NEAU-W12]MCX2927195.1 hypothetical protein [Streptomyces sp. NEAU-W12]
MTQNTAQETVQGTARKARTRRRLRSGTVMLGSMGVLAAALSACSSDPDRRCVDRDSYDYVNGYKVVADKNCTTSSGSAGRGGRSGSAQRVDADWYYDADVSGSWAEDGTFNRSEAVDRGGFGSSSGKRGG